MNPSTTRITFSSDCDADTVGSLLHGWIVTVYDFLGAKLAEGEVDGPNTDDDGLWISWGVGSDDHLEDVQIPWRDVANIEVA